MENTYDLLYNLCKRQVCGVIYLFKLLLIEDDATLFNEIKERLSQWSYEVYGITDFNDVIQEFAEVKPDLVIIDIQLPKFDGFHWCRMIRTHSNVPILFLSSRDHPTDMVMSMQLGADDFIQKPFHFDVLIAKVQATLRRVYNYNTEQVSIKTWCRATVDYERNTVSNERGSIELTKNEMYILKLLIDQKNKIVSRDALINSLWDDKRFISDNTLTVNVNRLRKRLEEIELGRFIETKVGQGYLAIEEDSP
jgi:two-component system, OmpR family, bacitracin resistance response regulator BceR